MAYINKIECLPQDVLRKIMSRLAGQPDGAADIARALAVSKSFQDFVMDEVVLRSVSFKDLFSCLDGRYELLSEVDGLVARCSRAGNSDALFILSKVVMVCASKLCKAKTEAAHSDASQDQNSTISSGNGNLSDLDKAVRLLDHFSAQNTDTAALHNLVRNFLVRAKFQDLVEMQHHLEDFVAMYHICGIKPHHQFCDLLDKLCKEELQRMPGFMKSTVLGQPSVLVDKFNAHLISIHRMMKDIGFDEQLLSVLLECSVEINYDVAYDTMIERLKMADSILEQASVVALDQQNFDVLQTIRDALFVVTVLGLYFTCHEHRHTSIENARGSLLASFDALFCIQHSS